MKAKLRRLLFPAPTPTERPTDDVHDQLVLLLVGILGLGGPIWEMLRWGPIQDCAYVFAGLGFGCHLR